MNIKLSELGRLQDLFKKLSAGSHINHQQDNELWADLENQRDAYQALFAALGYELTVDSRGFAYFNTDQASSYTGKLTRRLALLLMLLFEYQADQGAHLFQFQQWRLDGALLEKLWQTYRALLEAEEIGTALALKEICDSATRVGFLLAEDGAYRLLPAVHRYLDLFEELAKAERHEEAPTDTEDDALEDNL
ncbi:condensin complex protein MksE [Methylomicrobium lacus]|uniref:condensin complex protein MksE n=1 Tax=Methylomicrobium lacus TaxID=136992 RepID=UPI00045E7224|nr:hypothetical protein [Methylomicrobium lacus]